MSDILNQLAEVLEARKNADPDSSYVASLYDAGTDKILKKLGEEATETVIAGKGGDREEIIYETADLWFHSLVLLTHNNIEPQAILDELDRRFGLSGIEEKSKQEQIMTDCLFCKIVAGDIPSSKVYEDEQLFAFKDIYPKADVHILVIPKIHIKSLDDLTGEHQDLVAK